MLTCMKVTSRHRDDWTKNHLDFSNLPPCHLSLNLCEEGGSLTSKDLKYNWCNCDHVESNYNNAAGQVTAAFFHTIFQFTRESQAIK